LFTGKVFTSFTTHQIQPQTDYVQGSTLQQHRHINYSNTYTTTTVTWTAHAL